MKKVSLFLGLLVVAFTAVPLAAQPYGAFLTIPSGSGYIAIPHSSAFDFSTGYTFEAWVSVSDPGGCKSIFGKGWTTSQWVGVCGTTLRSYVRGYDSTSTSKIFLDAGKIPPNDWTHIAVTFDGARRKHYVDGELVGFRDETEPMTNNTQEVRIGSDVAFANSPPGSAFDEVRIWNVALTQAQIRANINKTINTPQTGLVAVYHLDGAGTDSIGGHNGTATGTAGFLTSPVAVSCTNSATSLCIGGNRFAVQVSWLTTDGSTGVGTVVPGYSADSGLFWFFGANNWELLVKSLNACSLNNRKWFFSAATTDVHYEIVVTDVTHGVVKRYFNYLGTAAPANTDTDAFATCP